MDGIYEANRAAAMEKMQKEPTRFSESTLLCHAEKAQLTEDMKEVFGAFLRFAANTPAVREYLYTRYYTVYQSGAHFTAEEYEKLPRLAEAEKAFPGFCEVAIALAAEEVFRTYLAEKQITPYIDALSYHKMVKRQMEQNRIDHGTYGFINYSGTRHGYAIGTLLRIGRLVYEKKGFFNFIEVYKKGNTYQRVALPDWNHTEEGYIGEHGAGKPPVYRREGDLLHCRVYGDDGRPGQEVVSLPLAKYELFLKPGDPVLGIHIPGEGPLTPESVDESLSLAKKVSECEEGKSRKFMCTSWLLDPQLQKILPPTSNIIRFQKRFHPISTWINGYSLYKHIFRTAPCPIEKLVPRNRFQEAILESLKSGRPMRHGHGFLDI